MDIRLSVVVMINIVKQFRYIKEKMPSISSWKKILEEVEWCKKMKYKHFNEDMFLTKDDELNFNSADKYHICNKKYLEKDIRVRDHCHLTGKYRGSAHQDCNINFRLIDKIPVIFHNLRGCDGHFIMQTIGEIANKHTYKNKKGEEKQMDINIIPNNTGKYMALENIWFLLHGLHAWKTFGCYRQFSVHEFKSGKISK